jgi:hypothetical protein
MSCPCLFLHPDDLVVLNPGQLRGPWWEVLPLAHAQGYHFVEPTGRLAGAALCDGESAAERKCEECGHTGLDLLVLSPLDGAEDYRPMTCCPECSMCEEF